MSECDDYGRHELWCEHNGRHIRWTTVDRCSGSCCHDCWISGPNQWNDLVALAFLDRDGIPLDRRAWTYGDTLGNLIRELTGERVGQ